MVENIDKVLDRGERIELLVDKSSTIQDNSFRFKKQSRRLQQALWMKNLKLMWVLWLYFLFGILMLNWML